VDPKRRLKASGELLSALEQARLASYLLYFSNFGEFIGEISAHISAHTFWGQNVGAQFRRKFRRIIRRIIRRKVRREFRRTQGQISAQPGADFGTLTVIIASFLSIIAIHITS